MQKPVAVSESAGPDGSEAPPTFWIWWRFGWDIEGRTQVILKKKFPVTESVLRLHLWSVLWNWTSQPKLHQLLDVGGVSECSDGLKASHSSRICWSFGWDVQFHETGHNCSSATDSITGNLIFNMTCVLPSISQPNLHQIQKVRGASEPSGPADSETAIGFCIWARFRGFIEVFLGDKWK